MQIACPYCKHYTIIKKGKRRKKLRTDQQYLCTSCQKTFVQTSVKNITYNAEVLRDALTLYNQGFTFEETAKILNKRFKVTITTSTVHRWNQQYKGICTYSMLRVPLLKQYGKDSVVSKNFEYQGLAYNFKYHIGKLELLCKDHHALASYIRKCQTGCPSFFSSIQHRCSQLRIEIIVEKTIVSDNLLCRQTALALSNYPTKKMRHSLVENFMLINDDTTVAAEVPVWLWEKNLNCSIAGHIDLIQIHDGYVYILDYKPDATKENQPKVASQLYLYASGLSFRTKIPLHHIRCAWFDDTHYFEFEPIKAKVQYTKTIAQSP